MARQGERQRDSDLLMKAIELYSCLLSPEYIVSASRVDMEDAGRA